MKIIKMVFHEKFNSQIGGTLFRCVRSPEKESEILRKMRGHPNFMQGEPVHDPPSAFWLSGVQKHIDFWRYVTDVPA